jgi:carbon monoxide dehydrogenase subunit G
MNIEGTHLFDAPQELVWRMLLDPVVLAKVMPNCQALEKTGEGEYEGKMKIQVGPVQGLFQGKVTLSDLQEPSSYHMHVQGKGPAGVVDGEGAVHLEGVDGKTVMHYTGEAKVSGRIASIGQRLMDTSARAIIKQSLENLEQQIVTTHIAQNAPTPAEHEEAMPQAELLTEPSAEASGAQVASRAEEGVTATEPTPKPYFRRAPASIKVPPPAPKPSAASFVQFASRIGKELLHEFVPADKHKWVVVGLGFLLVHLYINWWANVIARRTLRRISQRLK